MLAMHRSMAITAMLVPLISCWCVIVGAADELAAPWTRGESAALTVQPDGAMILLRRHTAATSSWWSGGAAQGCGRAGAAAPETSGHDWLGEYDRLAVGTLCAVRYYSSSDAFVFERRVGSSGTEPQWPQLSRSSAAPAPPRPPLACAKAQPDTDHVAVR